MHAPHPHPGASSPAHSEEVEEPISPHIRAQLQRLGAIFAPRAAERSAGRADLTLGPLLSRLPGVHHAEALRAGARNGGWGRGGTGRPVAAPTPDSRQGAPPRPLAQAHGTARVPAFPPTRAGTQRAGGKARSAAGIFGAASGPERPGADYRGRSRAHRNSALGRRVGRCAALLLLPSPSLNGRNGLAGRGGAERARRAQAPSSRPLRGEGWAPPFSLARPNGGTGCFSPRAEGATRRRESPRPSFHKFFPRSARFSAGAAYVALSKVLECDIKKEKTDTSAHYYNSLQLATSNGERGLGEGVRTLMQKR